MPDSAKRFNIWTPLIYSVVLVLGILIGFFLYKYQFAKLPISYVVERNDRLDEIIKLIESKYVDSVNADDLYNDAITGILGHLDPHTNYIPAKDLLSVNEELEGSFTGIGVEFYILNDTVMVTSVLKNGPSADAGVLPGDKIVQVNDSVVTGQKVGNDGIITYLRGVEGSNVQLGLLRTGSDKLMTVSVKRGAVPIYSIDAAYMIDDQTGYIKINRFSATTYREFGTALNLLKGKGMQQLILDLRDNPGGYLDAATAILDELIDGNKVLVYTQGRFSDKEEYMSGQKGRFEKGKLVIMLDEGSASASEVLAGAVQDWDRGVVIGRRSYGKGLVQEQYKLGDGSALRLTVAKYYTPTGRSIQRTYAKGKQAYAQDFEQRFSATTLQSEVDTFVAADTTKYFTEIKKRVVYGGGGIKPDIVLPYVAVKNSHLLLTIVGSSVFNATIYNYFSTHSQQFIGFKSFQEFESRFDVPAELLQTMRQQLLLTNDAKATQQIWQSPTSLLQLKIQVKATIARMLFRANGYYQEVNKDDDMVKRALKIINGSEYSAVIGR